MSPGKVSPDKVSPKVKAPSPTINTSQGSTLSVPQPGTTVRTGVPVSQFIPISQPQLVVSSGTVNSRVGTQPSTSGPVNTGPGPISMVNPIYSNVPNARPRTPEGDFEDLERMMTNMTFPTNTAVPRARPRSGTPQQLPILSGHAYNSTIPIAKNPHEGPGDSGSPGGPYRPPGGP